MAYTYTRSQMVKMAAAHIRKYMECARTGGAASGQDLLSIRDYRKLAENYPDIMLDLGILNGDKHQLLCGIIDREYRKIMMEKQPAAAARHKRNVPERKGPKL